MVGLEEELKGVKAGDLICLEAKDGVKYAGFAFSIEKDMIGMSHQYPHDASDAFGTNFYSLSEFVKFYVFKKNKVK